MVKIKILFKSGNSQILDVEDFGTKFVGDELTALNWVLPKGKVLFISLKDVEAVFQLGE